MEYKVSDQLIEILKQTGVKQVFGVTGDALNAVVDSIRKDNDLEWISVRHEEVGAFAASAQAALSGDIAVCAGTVGPGALHLINGLYNAKKERVPVLAISGQVSTDQIGSNYFQEVDLKKIYDDVCEYQAVVHSAEQAPRVIQKAIRIARQERAVCRIEIPVDITTSKATSREFEDTSLNFKSELTPSPSAIKEAVELIDESENITILAGEGCKNAKAEVVQLADKLNAPIAHTLKSMDIFDADLKYVVGLTGLIGNPSGYKAVNDCDLLIMLGTDFPYSNFLPENTKVIQVDVRAGNIGNRTHVDIGLLGGIKPTVKKLNILTKEKNKHSFMVKMREDFLKWRAQMDKDAKEERDRIPLHPQIVARMINDRASSDAIFTVDVGEATVWAARHLIFNGKRRMLSSFNHGSMAYSVPAAIGAQMLDRNREVWVLVGDGAFGMSLNSMITAARYDLPIKIIVFNNSELSFVKMEMEEAGLPRHDEALSLENPDFAAFAELCGGRGIRVEEAYEIESALESASKSKKPFLIDARVSPGELTLPPNITLENAWGFTKSKAKEIYLGAKGDKSQFENIKEEIAAYFD